VVLATLSGGIGAAATLALTDRGAPAKVITREVDAVAAKSAADGTVESAAAKIAPSVVTLLVTGTDAATGQQGAATGSGVVMNTDGFIVTNNHVVAGGANGGTVQVTFSNGTSKSAKIVGRDPSNDLAVVRVEGATDLKAATFAASKSLRIGQAVLAAGAPLGLSNTITEGIISAVNRPVRTGDGNGQDAVIDAVQTDAAINPGNSGGPLVDLAGRVVGINSAIATVSGGGDVPGQQRSQSGNIGVGFAIPSDDVVRIAQQLISKGTATHATLGVTVRDAGAGAGAAVAQVAAGSGADKAGLKSGDVITLVGDRRVTDLDSLVAAVRDHQPNDKVTITYQRGGKEQKVDVTLTGSGG
jgi:putative serine protease PepD